MSALRRGARAAARHSIQRDHARAEAANQKCGDARKSKEVLGFDMKLGPSGEKHWHPDHPGVNMQGACFGEWLHKFEPLAKDLKDAGCIVVNCTPGSALTCFPVSTIEKELP